MSKHLQALKRCPLCLEAWHTSNDEAECRVDGAWVSVVLEPVAEPDDEISDTDFSTFLRARSGSWGTA